LSNFRESESREQAPSIAIVARARRIPIFEIMATLREYFDTASTRLLGVNKPLTLHSDTLPEVEIQARLHLDFDSNAKFLSFYIPTNPNPLRVMAAVLAQLATIVDSMKGVEISAGFPEETPTNSSGLAFTGRVYFYSESDIPHADVQRLEEGACANGLSVRLRGKNFAAERSKMEKPLAFVCHDSRNKEAIARPIAIGLAKLMCTVWFDEFSLKVGDRLRESIEKGLKECKKCVLVLTPEFFGNSGWTKVEFNSIFTRELMEKSDFVMPVWAGVTKREVFDYSPSLVDRVAVDWNLGQDEVVRRLFRARQ
jgi:hypothetical protein